MSASKTTTGRGRWRGAATVVLRAGDTTAAFVPDLGFAGVSLRRGRFEFVATPGGPERLRAGHTLGLPLLAPWANRLAPGPDGYRVGRHAVSVPRRVPGGHRDDHGLLIHGLLVGRGSWRVVAERTTTTTTSVTAETELAAPVFPFPHRIAITAALVEGALTVTTTLTPTGRRAVPVAFGWHPYLRVPGTPRHRWILGLPARDHLELDDRGLPTGVRRREAAEAEPIGRRTFDDLYAPIRSRILSLEGDHAALALHGDRRYPYAQVWVPPGRAFAALEPMTAPTNALATGNVPLVAPGESFSAAFTLRVDVA